MGSNEPPFFTDLFDLLVLIVTPSVFDTQRLRASSVWLLYNLRPIARIDIAIGVFGEVSNLFNISKGGASYRIGACAMRDISSMRFLRLTNSPSENPGSAPGSSDFLKTKIVTDLAEMAYQDATL